MEMQGLSGKGKEAVIYHKFKNIPTDVDGIKFNSKKEAAYWSGLVLARKSGRLLFALRQVPFHVSGNVRYVVDFVEFWASGEVRFVDVKGFKTPMYNLKKKLVEAEYPINILES